MAFVITYRIGEVTGIAFLRSVHARAAAMSRLKVLFLVASAAELNPSVSPRAFFNPKVASFLSRGSKDWQSELRGRSCLEAGQIGAGRYGSREKS